MINLAWFLIAALFTWRLASLFAHERGVFGIFTLIRQCVGVEHEFDGEPSVDPQTGEVLLHAVTPWPAVDAVLFEIARIVTCVWCNSIWIALLISAPLVGNIVPVLTFTPARYVLTAGALSSSAILIDHWLQR